MLGLLAALTAVSIALLPHFTIRPEATGLQFIAQFSNHLASQGILCALIYLAFGGMSWWLGRKTKLLGRKIAAVLLLSAGHMAIFSFVVSLVTTFYLGTPATLTRALKLTGAFHESKDYWRNPVLLAGLAAIALDHFFFRMKPKWFARSGALIVVLMGLQLSLVLFRGVGRNSSHVSAAPLSALSPEDLHIHPHFIATNEFKRVIVVIVESLSLVNTSAGPNRMSDVPRLEKLADRFGITFQNLIANATYSDVSLYTLFTGLPALDISNDEYSPFTRSLVPKENVFSVYAAAGFKTILLAGHRLEFESMDQFAKRIPIDIAMGLEQSRILQAFPRRPVFGSPPDEALYAATENELGQIQHGGKVFAVLVTVSSHLPWTDPYTGHLACQRDVFAYVDETLAQFIERISASPEGEDTLVVVTGDHRMRTPIEKDEETLYGTSAPYRVAGFLISKKFAKRETCVIRNVVFHQDLLQDLGSWIKPGNDLSFASGPRFVHDHLRRNAMKGEVFFALDPPTPTHPFQIVPVRATGSGVVEVTGLGLGRRLALHIPEIFPLEETGE